MAKFDTAPQQTNDPSYLGLSQSPERQRSFPMENNTFTGASDKTLGTALEGLSTMIGSASQGFYKIINEDIKQDAFAKVDPIRDAHGSSVTVDEVPAIAGKGIRGTKYTNADGQLVDSDTTDPLPPGARNSIAGLQRMTAARDAGALSDSHYDASLLAATKELRAKYPGFREEVDAAVSGITGIDSANALRKNILADMNARASAADSANNKANAWYEKDQALIHSVYPNITKAQAIANRDKIEVSVGNLKAQKFGLELQDLQLKNSDMMDSNRAAKAVKLVTDTGNLQTSVYSTGVLNTLGDKIQGLIKQGASADPKEIQSTNAAMGQAELKMSQSLDAILNKPISETSSETPRSIIIAKYGQSKIDDIKATILSPIKDLHGLINNQDYGAAHAALNILKNRGAVDAVQLGDNVPAVRTIGAFSKAGADPVTVNFILEKTRLLPEISAAIVNTGIGKILDTKSGSPPPKVSAIINATKNGNPDVIVSPLTTKTALETVQDVATHKDPEVAARGVDSLFGDTTWFARIPLKQKQQVWEAMSAPGFTDKMVKLKETKPEAWKTYKQWSEDTFVTMTSPTINNVKGWPGAASSDYDWNWNEKAAQIELQLKPGISRGYATAAAEDRARGMVQDVARINRGLNLMKPVYDADGQNTGEKLFQLLKTNGLDVNAPQREIGEGMKPFIEKLKTYLPSFIEEEKLNNPVRK